MTFYPRISRNILIGLISLVGLLGLHVSAVAKTSVPAEHALLQSMKERLPELMQMKLQGQIGETNMGLLEARTVIDREQRRLLADENRDRLAHYKLIAEKLELPVAAVQRKRAEQIRRKSPAGVWIESMAGEWLRK